MKTLLVLLILALALGAGYWATQHPDRPITDIPGTASNALGRIGDGLQAVRDGSAEREAEVAASAAERQRLSARIDELSRNGGVAPTAADNSGNNTASGPMPAAVAERLEGVEERIDLLVRNLDRQAAAEDSSLTPERLDTLDQRLDEEIGLRTEAQGKLQSILSDLERAVGSVESRIETLSSDLAGGSATTDATAGDTPARLSAAIDARLSQMETRIGSSGSADSGRMEFIVGQLEANAETLGTLEQRLDDSSALIGSLNDRIDELTTRTESTRIDDQQDQLREQLANLESQLSTGGDDADVSDLSNSLESSRERIQALEQRLQELPTSSTASDEAQKVQKDLESQIAALSEQIESMPNQLKQEVNELAAGSFVTREELAKQKEGRNREYKIYFDRNSTVISDAAARVLDSFITQEKNRTVGVSIFGFTDRRGDAEYNQSLALRRATNVRTYLLQNGFDFSLIKQINGLGEDAAAAVLPDESDDAQQRVVVLFAEQP